MAKKKIWFDEIIPDQKDIHLAGKDSNILSAGYSIVKANIINDKNAVNLSINNVLYVQ